MPSKKQWVLIVFATLLTASTTSGENIGALIGAAAPGALVSYALVTGYNGRDLWGEFKNWVAG